MLEYPSGVVFFTCGPSYGVISHLFLQFLKRRGTEVTEVVVRKATHGMKEADASQISVLNDLFCPMQKKRVKDLGMTEGEESKYVGRLARTIESTGAPDKVALGEVVWR